MTKRYLPGRWVDMETDVCNEDCTDELFNTCLAKNNEDFIDKDTCPLPTEEEVVVVEGEPWVNLMDNITKGLNTMGLSEGQLVRVTIERVE